MNLLKSFEATSLVKATSGYLYEKFYPLAFQKYIIINTDNEDQNSNYLFWNRVVQLITPYLEKQEINIVEFAESKKFNFDHLIIDKTVSLAEKTYLIKKAKFFCGSSKFYSLIASEYNVDQCVLRYDYEIDNLLAEKNQIIESREKRKGFLNPVGNNINNIRPEEIAEVIIKRVCGEIEFKCDKTLSIGKVFSIPSIDLIPDCNFKISNSKTPNETIIRMDYFFSEENLVAQLNHYPCSIVTNKPINKDILNSVKKRIKKLYFKVEQNSDASFLDDLDSLNINYDIITNLKEKELEKEKIKYLDYKKINKLNLVDLSFINDIDKSKVYFRTNKILIKSGNTYGSRWHLKNNLPTKEIRNANFSLPPEIDDSFREEADNFYFLTSEDL